MRVIASLCIVALLGIVLPVRAHPVPKNNHDRTIAVHLQKSDKPNHLKIHVEFRLEVDETTVLLRDMEPFLDEVDYADYKNKPLEYYGEFTRIYAPIFANRLVASVNDRRIALACKKRSARLIDPETEQPLGHLRCDFVFEAEAGIEPDRENSFLFRDGTYQLQTGQILVSFVNDANLQVKTVQAPDEALQKRSLAELRSGDDEKLRLVKVTFLAPEANNTSPKSKQSETPPAEPEAPTDADQAASKLFNDHDSLLWIMAGDYGFWFKLLLVTLLGAVHALTPGHGKTLVAAYLIGQRGTVWHALILGIITTLTHTGAVLILAIILFFLPLHLRDRFQEVILQGLGLAAGLMIVSLGVWLLLQRLAGRADHIHLGGGHDHSHGHDHTHSRGLDTGTEVRWWSLLVLGVTGGLIPCADAVGVFLYFTFRGEFWMVLPALVCFSAGLAGVLVLIGILVVRMPKFARSRLGEGRFVHALPIVSALVIIAMGFWLCYQGVK
jgi:ABC-type nickel/cobalt efflux system permease component RcnA